MAGHFGRQTGNVSIHGEARVHLGDNYVTHQYYTKQQAQPDIDQTLVDSLRFDGMGARVRNVGAALPTTCEWLPRHQDFIAWVEGRRLHEHNGFLWIKGKPGSGKSTIMKETLAWFEKACSNQIVLCYFFNARSPQHLDKSSLGLYRSLLWQLLTACSISCALFVEHFALKVRQRKVDDGIEMEVEAWTEIELQNFLVMVFQKLQQLPPVTIFVDALDEGTEDDIRRMVRFLERVTHCATAAFCPLRICLSSRHYPHISVAKSFSIVLEDQAEHFRDIKLYIQSELVQGSILGIDQLRHAILTRSKGVFLWVVLVIPVLNRAYDQGRNAATMLQKLDDIPQDLSNVFTQILLKDTEDLDECVTLLQWVLFAKAPLGPVELYCIVKKDYFFTGPDASTVAFEESMKYVRSCSRGLVELTKIANRDSSVQFIHETIRGYLMGGETLKQRESELSCLGISTQEFSAGICHEKLAEDCLRCLLQCCYSLNSKDHRHNKFVGYAAKHWWQHFQLAQSACIESVLQLALNLLTGGQDSLRFWHNLYDIEQRYLHRNEPAPPIYYAALIGRHELVSSVLNHGADVNATGGKHRTALQVASVHGYQQVVQILVDAGADVDAPWLDDPAIVLASEAGHEQTVRILVDAGANVDACGHYGPATFVASKAGHERVVQILVDAGANLKVAARGRRGENIRDFFSKPRRIRREARNEVQWEGEDLALNAASEAGHEKVVQILLDAGADVGTLGSTGHTALYEASMRGHEKVVQVLVKAGAGVNAYERGFGTALHAASAKGHEEVVKMLVEAGADVNVRRGSFGTALRAASMNGHEKVVEILAEAGAEINDSEERTSTALEAAVDAGHDNVVQILRERGAKALVVVR